MRAFLNLRYGVPNRRKSVEAGLRRCGYTPTWEIEEPKSGDVLVTWNRIGAGERWAQRFVKAGCDVLVMENATWGNGFLGGEWYHIARTYHNTAGMYPVGDASRWDNLGVTLARWRLDGETVILPQRGIGSPPVSMPANWPRKAVKRHGGRVRKHPGQRTCIPLKEDLAAASEVITWGSGAAIKALMWGIKVVSYMPNWIGEQDNTDDGRLAMFRRLAWAQWQIQEIATGEPFARLLAK